VHVGGRTKFAKSRRHGVAAAACFAALCLSALVPFLHLVAHDRAHAHDQGRHVDVFQISFERHVDHAAHGHPHHEHRHEAPRDRDEPDDPHHGDGALEHLSAPLAPAGLAVPALSGACLVLELDAPWSPERSPPALAAPAVGCRGPPHV
jgi:hypothetical protein